MMLAVVGGVLLLAGALAVLTGVLPLDAVVALADRTVPVLGFVVAITVVAALAAEAGVFAWIADAAAHAARGRGAVLWLLVVAVAVLSTVFLSLDTTAVLLTPIVVTMARRVGLPPMPFALTTVWLANTASLLLPVSNLTNLLAESAPALRGRSYVALSALPAVVAVVVPVLVLAVVYRRSLTRRYAAQPWSVPADRRLRTVAAVIVALLVPALVSGLPVWIPASAAALVLVIVFSWRRRTALRFGLLPWQLVVFVCGLFLTVAAVGRVGATAVLEAVAGSGDSPVALLQVAGVGTAAANLVDNLPAYLLLEPVAESPARLIALLVAVNAGSLITPWASLATLLWQQRLAAMDVRISWWRFAGLGLIVAPLTVGAATLAIGVTR
ncbi:SLC13 family permease [uncultured Amnibacterium sp.]|uniref:SLC13 family permease n=1 Tax=uncultured Amnibacterium sp. TaxID=1631851 RepID=UPI0035C9AF04